MGVIKSYAMAVLSASGGSLGLMRWHGRRDRKVYVVLFLPKD
jgi:hypothetical protein